jgi:Zn-dependent protease
MPPEASERTTGGLPRSLALRLDISWLPTFALVLWWFASIGLPGRLEGLSQPLHWLLALALTLGLLVSVTLHEVAHALVEARYGGKIEPVRLYPFGGVRQRDAGAQGPEAEFMVAIAGPAFSLLMAFGLLVASRLAGSGATLSVLLLYLAALNAAIALLNLVPAFPLDGGRALRAILWTLRNDFSWATTISVRLGSTFGLFLLILGIYIVLSDGGPVSGMTALLIGLTLRNAATFSYRDLHFIYKHQLKMLPVVDGDRLMGYVTAQRVKEMPREEWSRQSIGTIALPFSAETTVGPETEAIEALDKMTRSGLSRLMVVDHERLAGTVSLQALLGGAPVATATDVEA